MKRLQLFVATLFAVFAALFLLGCGNAPVEGGEEGVETVESEEVEPEESDAPINVLDRFKASDVWTSSSTYTAYNDPNGAAMFPRMSSVKEAFQFSYEPSESSEKFGEYYSQCKLLVLCSYTEESTGTQWLFCYHPAHGLAGWVHSEKLNMYSEPAYDARLRAYTQIFQSVGLSFKDALALHGTPVKQNVRDLRNVGEGYAEQSQTVSFDGLSISYLDNYDADSRRLLSSSIEGFTVCRAGFKLGALTIGDAACTMDFAKQLLQFSNERRDVEKANECILHHEAGGYGLHLKFDDSGTLQSASYYLSDPLPCE